MEVYRGCTPYRLKLHINMRNIIMTNEVKCMTLERSLHTLSGASSTYVNTISDRMMAPPHMAIMHSLSLMLGAFKFHSRTLLTVFWGLGISNGQDILIISILLFSSLVTHLIRWPTKKKAKAYPVL